MVVPHPDPRQRMFRESLDRIFQQRYPDPEECRVVVTEVCDYLGSLSHQHSSCLPSHVDTSFIERACYAYTVLRTRLQLVYPSRQGIRLANRLAFILRDLRKWFERGKICHTEFVFREFIQYESRCTNPAVSEEIQEDIARRNRGYLEYLAFRRFVREQGHHRLESTFLEEVRRLELEHLLPSALPRLNDFDFSDDGGL